MLGDSFGFALSPWQHLPQIQILVPPVPISEGQACGVRFALSAISSLDWHAKKRPIKKQSDGQGLGLRWPPFVDEKQKSTSSLRPRWDGCQSLETRWGWSVWGDTVPSFGATIQTMKKNIYEIHWCLWMARD